MPILVQTDLMAHVCPCISHALVPSMRKDRSVSSQGKGKDPELLHLLTPVSHSNDEGQISLDAYRGNREIIMTIGYGTIYAIAKATQDVSEECC